MARSSQVQKAIRLNAAYRLLAQGMSMAEAAARLSRDVTISRRQAYRYLNEARELERPVGIVAPAQPITFKIPADVIRALRTYAADNELTMSEVVTRAITGYVRRGRRHG
jgi:predicted DNA-binding transcriptional regulator YafY